MVKTLSNKRPRKVEREYQVESILDKRIQGNKTQYLLKWKGYSNADNSWEDEGRLNCPELFKAFEKRLKLRNTRKRSTSKNTNMEDTDEDYQSIEDQSSSSEESGAESPNIDDNDGSESDRMTTRQSPRKKARLSSPKSNSSPGTRRHSNRAIVTQTKSRITSMSKDDSSVDDTTEAEEESIPPPIKQLKRPARVTRKASNDVSIIGTDDENNQNNNSIEISGKNTSKKTDTNRPMTRFRVTANTASSISFSTNANEHGNDKMCTENLSEIVDETDQVEYIETARYYRNEISFRIKLINENEARWIPAKIANRKYPQGIITFWESHVEFT